MKIIHTADLHLDSKLNRHLDDSKASERRNELLTTFQKIIHYAVSNKADAILIAGDLFDTRKISATARDSVISAILNNPKITFYYLRGNHDLGSFLNDFRDRIKGELPDNLKLFDDNWISYVFKGTDGEEVVITGAEVTKENNTNLEASLVLDQSKCNIVMLHGQETETAGKNDAQVIPIRSYRNRGIDYLALGHVHQPKIERLDSRGVYSYCGCPEGRGFDEIGPRGFNLLTIHNQKVDVQFVPFSQRTIFDVNADVSDCLTNDDAIGVIEKLFEDSGILEKDLIKVRLCGETEMDVHFDLEYIAHRLNESYYLVRVKDETKPRIDYSRFLYDKSLKGEFVRKLEDATEQGEVTQSEAAEIIALGIRLLSGEEKLS